MISLIVVSTQSSVTRTSAFYASLGGDAILSYGVGRIELVDGSIIRIATPENAESAICGLTIDELIISYDIESDIQGKIIQIVAPCLSRHFKAVHYF